jgi:hypothetical protein
MLKRSSSIKERKRSCKTSCPAFPSSDILVRKLHSNRPEKWCKKHWMSFATKVHYIWKFDFVEKKKEGILTSVRVPHAILSLVVRSKSMIRIHWCLPSHCLKRQHPSLSTPSRLRGIKHICKKILCHMNKRNIVEKSKEYTKDQKNKRQGWETRKKFTNESSPLEGLSLYFFLWAFLKKVARDIDIQRSREDLLKTCSFLSSLLFQESSCEKTHEEKTSLEPSLSSLNQSFLPILLCTTSLSLSLFFLVSSGEKLNLPWFALSSSKIQRGNLERRVYVRKTVQTKHSALCFRWEWMTHVVEA